jgi:hypothetical protein
MAFELEPEAEGDDQAGVELEEASGAEGMMHIEADRLKTLDE